MARGEAGRRSCTPEHAPAAPFAFHRAGLRADERISPTVTPSHETRWSRSGSACGALDTQVPGHRGYGIHSITVAGAAPDWRDSGFEISQHRLPVHPKQAIPGSPDEALTIGTRVRAVKLARVNSLSIAARAAIVARIRAIEVKRNLRAGQIGCKPTVKAVRLNTCK